MDHLSLSSQHFHHFILSHPFEPKLCLYFNLIEIFSFNRIIPTIFEFKHSDYIGETDQLRAIGHLALFNVRLSYWQDLPSADGGHA